MKIALANNLYYPFNRGGAEAVVKKMVTDLTAGGHEVFLITTISPEETIPQVEELNELKFKIYHIISGYYNLAHTPLILKIFWHIGNIFSFRKTRIIKKILQTEKPDLILTHNLMGLGFLLPRAIKKLKIRHEHYLHDIQLLHPSGLIMFGQEKIIDSLAAKLYQLFTRTLFASPAKIISPSVWLLEQYRQRGFFRNSETEVKNLISADSKEQKAEASKNNLSETSKNNPHQNFLFVGQVEYHKGIFLLIKAFQAALLINSNLKLTVIGNGEQLEKAKKLTENNEQIKFSGRLDGSQVKALMAESDCLIVPSLCYENAPLTIFEAHAAGLSVLAANIGGIPEIIKVNDELFKPGDVEDLKNHILGLK